MNNSKDLKKEGENRTFFVNTRENDLIHEIDRSYISKYDFVLIFMKNSITGTYAGLHLLTKNDPNGFQKLRLSSNKL